METNLPKISVGGGQENSNNGGQDEQTHESHEHPSGTLNVNPKLPSKSGNGPLYLDVPLQTSFRPSVDTISDISLYSSDNDNERSSRVPVRSNSHTRIPSRSPAPPRTWKGKWEVFWQGNKGFILVLIAQMFGALMTAATRLLETDKSHGAGMHPFQVR